MNIGLGIAVPFPRRDGVAEEIFQQWTEGAFAVVAVGEQDHAGLVTHEADHEGLCAVAVAFLKKGFAETGLCEQAPAHTVGKADLFGLRAFCRIFGGKLPFGADLD